MSTPTTSPDIPNVISSLELVAGRSLREWPIGTTRDLFGQDHVHVNHSRLQGNDPASTTIATSGHTSGISSRCETLQYSLESNLRMRLTGSRLFGVIWKKWVAPWGASLSRPRVRALVTGGIVSGLLPTPSGTSNHGKNHVAGRLDEWGGSGNPFRGTNLGRVHCPAFELWVMGYPEAWAQLMPPAMQSSRRSQRSS